MHNVRVEAGNVRSIRVEAENERSMGSVVSELKDEAKDFVSTRIEMLRSEMKDKVASFKIAGVMIAGALLLGGTAWLILTGALVAVIAAAFYPSDYAAFFALIIVGVGYALIAGVMAAFAMRELKRRGVKPERTLRVLKQDQVWLQNEARSQL